MFWLFPKNAVPLSAENIYYDRRYTTGGTKDDDYGNLLNAARKAVEHGYRVFIQPNPKGIRTADFIFDKQLFDKFQIISPKSSLFMLFPTKLKSLPPLCRKTAFLI